MMNDFDPVDMTEEQQAFYLLLLRLTIIVCLFLAALSVLDAFISLFSYWVYCSGRMDPNHYQEWIQVFQKQHPSPYLFIGMNLYNIILWNGVIVGCIWLLRYHHWSRRVLGFLLGLDMVVTVMHLLSNVSNADFKIASPGWFIMMNILQVGAIIVLSHPNIIQLIDQLSVYKKKTLECKHNDPPE